MNSRSSVGIFLCVLFAVATSSPAGKKGMDTAARDLEKKIVPLTSEDGNEGDDDLLARAKKSSTTTTFCVEIKPGNEQPAVVICDPSKSDQVPIPSHPVAPPPKPHHPEPYHHPQQNPEPIPELPPQFEPMPYEPMIYIPQQPQIVPSFYPQPCPQQSQIILIRDPSCPSSNPTMIPNLYHSGIPAGYLHSSKQFMRASQYPMDSADIWQNRYGVEGAAQRSFSGSGSSGIQSFGYTNPLELIYPKRGPTSQQNPLTISPITSNGAVIGGHQNPDSQYDRPVLIQCNPTVTPLSQQAYSSATAGVSDNQGYKTNPGMMQGAVGGQTKFMQQPGGFGSQGIQMDQGSLSYQRGGLPMSNVNQYNQPGMYPQQQFHNMQHHVTSGYSTHGKSAEELQGGIKNGEKISTHELKRLEGGQSQFDNQGHQGIQGIPGGEGKTLSNLQDQQKFGPGKSMEGNQNPETRFNPGSFGQGEGSFANNNNNNDNKDQGFHRQMAFSQTQPQQQQQQPMPKMGQKNSQQPLNGDMAHSQMLMNRMKSSIAQGNLVQPFMTPSSNFAGEKQMPSKV